MIEDKRKKIEVINRGRATGRTTELIRRCAKHDNALIVTTNKNRARSVFEQARSQGIYIPFPITFKEFCRGEFYGRNVDAFLFDDLDDSLKEMAMGVPIETVVIEGDETNTGDLISRQAVKNWIQRWKGYIDEDIIARMQCRVIDIPSAKPSQRWIPCSKRLPENGRQVLVFARSVHFALAKYDEMREADGKYQKQWVTFDAWKPFYTIKEVIAWMPLPEPYRAERWKK